MKRSSTVFLKVLLVLIAATALAAMIRFPQTEGRAATLDLLSIYTDPFVIYLYIASIPFFTGLYQAFTLLGYIGENKLFSQAPVKAFKNIKYCAIAVIGFIAAAIVYVFSMGQTTNEDGTGAIVMGMLVIVASGVIAFSADVFQKRLQKKGKN